MKVNNGNLIHRLQNKIARVICYLFHRRFWDYQTYGGEWEGRHFHHMEICTRCDEFWPEYLD